MVFSLVNFSVVLLFLFLAVRKFTKSPIDSILAVFSLFWAVAVTSGLILSFVNMLGNSWAWFACSSLASGAIFAITNRCPGSAHLDPLTVDTAAWDEIRKNSRFDIKIIGIVAAGLVAVNVMVALSYPPTNWDANTYHLPRAFFYMSQGNLNHFPTVNFRQTFLTFNPTLLIIWLSVFRLSEILLALVNPFCWAICMLGVYRLSVLSGASRVSALIVAVIGGLAPGVYAQGASTTTDIQQASLILCSAVFALSYVRDDNRWEKAILSVVAFGLATGIKVTGFFFGPIIVIFLLWALYKNGIANSLGYLSKNKTLATVAVLLFLWFAIPFMVYNYLNAGVLMTAHYDYLRNKPFEIYSWLQAMYTFAVQLFIAPLRFLFNEKWVEDISKHYLFPFWNRKYAFNDLQIIIPGISEDSLWYSLSPYLLVVAFGNELRKKEHWSRPSFIFLLASLSWFVTYCAVGKWGMYNQRYFISAFLLAMPSLAMLCDVFYRSKKILPQAGRYAIRLLLFFMLVQTLVCLRDSYYRPVMPLIRHGKPSAALDILPPRMKKVLEGRKELTLVQYSWQHQDERLYPFIRVMPDARFALKQYRMEQTPDIPPQPLTGFNLISMWGTTEGNFFTSIPASQGWVLIPAANKKFPGVVSLGAIGQWYTDYFKYFSFDPGQRNCQPDEKNILFLALHDQKDSIVDGTTIKRFRKLRLISVGLNQGDGLLLSARATLKDGTREIVWNTDRDGYADVMLSSECTKLFVELRDKAGQVKGRGEIIAVPFTAKIQPQDIGHLDLVRDPVAKEMLTVTGMAESEGPYTSMGLPKIRWSTEKEVSFIFENKDYFLLDSVFLDLEFQPQAKGKMEVFANDKPETSFSWNDTNWQTMRVNVPLTKGGNEIVLKTTFTERSQELAESKTLLMFRAIQFRGFPHENE